MLRYERHCVSIVKMRTYGCMRGAANAGFLGKRDGYGLLIQDRIPHILFDVSKNLHKSPAFLLDKPWNLGQGPEIVDLTVTSSCQESAVP